MSYPGVTGTYTLKALEPGVGHTPIIPELKRQKQGNHKFKASLQYVTSLRLARTT